MVTEKCVNKDGVMIKIVLSTNNAFHHQPMSVHAKKDLDSTTSLNYVKILTSACKMSVINTQFVSIQKVVSLALATQDTLEMVRHVQKVLAQMICVLQMKSAFHSTVSTVDAEMDSNGTKLKFV